MANPSQGDLPLADPAELIDTMNCGLMARDADNRVVFANEALARWLGYGRKETIGMLFSDFVVPELQGRLEEEIDALREGDLRLRVFALRRKDGTAFPVLMVPALWIDEYGLSLIHI